MFWACAEFLFVPMTVPSIDDGPGGRSRKPRGPIVIIVVLATTNRGSCYGSRAILFLSVIEVVLRSEEAAGVLSIGKLSTCRSDVMHLFVTVIRWLSLGGLYVSRRDDGCVRSIEDCGPSILELRVFLGASQAHQYYQKSWNIVTSSSFPLSLGL